MRKIIVSNSLPEKTTEDVIDDINEALEIPVIGCPTIHHSHEKVFEDYDNRSGQITISALGEIAQRISEADSAISFGELMEVSVRGANGSPGEQIQWFIVPSTDDFLVRWTNVEDP